MRLLVIGTPEGQPTTATRIARDKGASAVHADCIDAAVATLGSADRGADLLTVDIRDIALRLEAERIGAPPVACGNAGAAAAAIRAGAKEYILPPPDPEIVAAILAAIADGHCEFVYREEASAKVARAALAAEALTRALVGRTVADVERALILETLKHCLGNRTRAANILGISIRTLRNKLTGYAADGAGVPPPNSGEVRGAA